VVIRTLVPVFLNLAVAYCVSGSHGELRDTLYVILELCGPFWVCGGEAKVHVYVRDGEFTQKRERLVVIVLLPCTKSR
jgi:hypothetical protein